MTELRRHTEQIKKMRQILEDIKKHSELLEQEAIRIEADKGINILDKMEKDNESKRRGE